MDTWTTITFDEERVTSKMPAADSVVEVKLRDGSTRLAWFDADIMEAGDWDFIPVADDYGEPDIDGNSIAADVTAWRPRP